MQMGGRERARVKTHDTLVGVVHATHFRLRRGGGLGGLVVGAMFRGIGGVGG